MTRLAGKVAIVTGAGSGIGRAIALAYSREGANVVAVDRDGVAAEATAADASGPGEVLSLVADIAQADQVRRMVSATIAAFGKLNVLVNNAAIQLHGQDSRCHELEEGVWDRTMSVNLRGPFLCTKYALPELIAAGGGSIINIASPTAFGGNGAGYTAYASSKGGVVTLTRVVATDYARERVRVNAIVPGATETPLITDLLRDEEIRASLQAATPLGRLGQPEDVVGIAVYLASDESAFATGALFAVDGGLTMR
jgi:NAD(P)-dependent dehydrogenase (short-subunit alcohol dehydrogenase family)